MNAGLLEHPAADYAHGAAAARRALGVGALPGGALEAAGRQVGGARRPLRLVLQHLEGRADPVAQRLEPVLREALLGLQVVGKRPVGDFVAAHRLESRLSQFNYRTLHRNQSDTIKQVSLQSLSIREDDLP